MVAVVMRFAITNGLLSDEEKTVATAGRPYGGPSEKFVGVLGGIFRSCPLTSQKLPLCTIERPQTTSTK